GGGGGRGDAGRGGQGEEGGQLPQLLWIANQPGPHPAVAGGIQEIAFPEIDLPVEGLGVRGGQGQGTGGRIEVALPQAERDAAVDRRLILWSQLGVAAAETLMRGMVGDVERPVVQALGGKIPTD